MSEPTPSADAAAEVVDRLGSGAATRTGAPIPAQATAAGSANAPIAIPEQAAGTEADTASTVTEPAADTPETDRVFVTPGWVATPRTPHARQALEQLLPQQADPEHDHLATHAHAPLAPEVVERGHWVGPRTGRLLVGSVVVIFLAGAVYGGFRIAATHSTASIVLTLIACLCAAGVFALMATGRPTVVDLVGTTVSVRHESGRDRFELADPFQEVTTYGEPGTAGWTLVLGRPDGSQLTLDGNTVDSAALAPVVARARALADRRRSARDTRFNL